MELNILLEYIDILTLGFCLCLGFMIKPIDKINNKYIPLIMGIIGTIISIVTHFNNLNPEIILGGMISGLASTGMYETFKNLLTGTKVAAYIKNIFKIGDDNYGR